MDLVIEKKQIKDWLSELKKESIVIDSKKNILPIKQYFFPPKEDLFIFDKKTKQLDSPDYKKELIIICHHLGQLEAMTQLDEIMEKPNSDFFYWQRREKSILIGLIDESVEVAPGGDLILEKINSKQYRALIITDKGRSIISGKFFKKVEKLEVKKYSGEENIFKEKLLDSELLANTVEWSKDHKIWDELAQKCLGCGICTYVCPLCHCFSMQDRVSLDDKKCTRCRQWDACTLPQFAKVAGGHDFHKTIKERYYNWFYHKFVRAYKEYGKAQCVACGSCGRSCPAGIKIGEVLKELVEDYKKYEKSI